MKLNSVIFLVALAIAPIVSTMANEKPVVVDNDDSLLIRELLRLDHDKFKEPPKGYDSLAEYKKWEKLYMKYAKTNSKDKTLTYEEAKILLLIGFIAEQNQDAATRESFASDLVPLFEANHRHMLNAMSEIKFLIEPTCNYLNTYFGFEGKNANKKTGFLKKYEAQIATELGATDSTVCLDHLKK